MIYAHDANGNLSYDLQQAVADKLVAYKPAGIKVFVLPTHKSVVALDIEVAVNDTTLEQDSFLELIKQTLSEYINTLTVGDPLYKANIIQKVMDVSDTGVIDTKVDVKVYPDSEMIVGESSLDDDSVVKVKGVLVNQPYLRPVDITSESTYGLLNVDNTKIKERDGNTYKDAIDKNSFGSPDDDISTVIGLQSDITNSLGNSYVKGIEVDDIYRTNSNEILRLALCNVHFKYADFDEPIDTGATHKTITRTIHIFDINGQLPKTISQAVNYTRYWGSTGLGNEGFSDWEADGNDTWDEYIIPQHEGYKSQVNSKDVTVIPSQHVNPNDEDTIVNVIYKKDPTMLTSKTITRTIYIHDTDGSVDIISQKVTFMRYIVTDAQGNPTSYTDWEGDGNFDEYAIPQHEGFISQIGSKDTKVVPSQLVNPNDEDTIVNVTYKQDPTTNTNNNIE